VWTLLLRRYRLDDVIHCATRSSAVLKAWGGRGVCFIVNERNNDK
jgi:hypothetical protein